MENRLNSVALCITTECTHKCPMCYVPGYNEPLCEGNIDTLKAIALELKKAGVKEINLVGGNPAEYSQIEELVKYLCELGFDIPILSNTHIYKNSSIERITPYVTSLEGTFHAHSASAHDEFCGKDGAYNTLLGNLKLYSAIKRPNQKVGLVMNLMKHNYNSLYQIAYNLLDQGLPIDYAMIQRVGPAGKASDKSFTVTEEEIIKGFENIKQINEELGIETIMVDAFPYCVVPKEYHKYMAKCDWGYGTASVDMYGNLIRCAVAGPNKVNSLGNVLQTPLTEIWENNVDLIRFRNKEYVDDECKNCKMLNNCGGGCAISCGSDILSSDILVKRKVK